MLVQRPVVEQLAARLGPDQLAPQPVLVLALVPAHAPVPELVPEPLLEHGLELEQAHVTALAPLAFAEKAHDWAVLVAPLPEPALQLIGIESSEEN